MGVEMDRDIDRVFKCLDQFGRRGRTQHTGHVLKPQNMRTGFFQFARHTDIVIKVIFRAAFVVDIAGITNGRFAEFVGFKHRFHRDLHVFNPVQAIKHPEDIHAVFSGLFDEVIHRIIGIVRIAHRV